MRTSLTSQLSRASEQAQDCRGLQSWIRGYADSVRKLTMQQAAARGKAINMLRVSDVAELFSASGIRASVIPSRVVSESYRGGVQPWWRERYDDAALFTQLALVAGPAE